MRPFYISLFIFCIIGVLAAIAAVFPEDGIRWGEAQLRYPTLRQMFEQDTTLQSSPLSPEQLLAQRATEMHIRQQEEYLDFFNNNAARIQFPKDSSAEINYSYFDPFYEALDGADTTAVRVVHYGDSQIEEDRISVVLRRELQSKFGGMGIGLVPLYQTVQSLTEAIQTSREPQRYMVFGSKSFRRPDSRRYGPMGQMAVVDTTVSITFSPRSKQTGLYSAHYFNRATILTSGNINVSWKGGKLSCRTDGSAMTINDINLADSTRNLTLTFSGNGDVYGISLASNTGVNVDNIPMRGCSGTIFSGIDNRQLSAYFSHTNTRLIIMQFGGNSMPYIKTEAQADKYINSLLTQVRFIRRQAPEAVILFIGPSDMTTRLQGKMQTYPLLPYFDRQLAQTLTEKAGVAYWSLFDSMGCVGAMSAWVKSGLAASDYIHFTRKGANEVGEMLYHAILTGYNYYQWREQSNKKIDLLEADSVQLAL